MQKRWALCVYFEAQGLCTVEFFVNVAMHAAACICRLPALWSLLHLEKDWRCGLWEANLIGSLPHTNSIQLLPALSTCRRRHGENEQEQQEHMNRKNRWGLFFINGVGVKLAGWAHVATHWIECLVYLGCVYRLRDDLVYSSEKILWCSINVTNQPHQQFIRFYTDLSGRELWIGA